MHRRAGRDQRMCSALRSRRGRGRRPCGYSPSPSAGLAVRSIVRGGVCPRGCRSSSRVQVCRTIVTPRRPPRTSRPSVVRTSDAARNSRPYSSLGRRTATGRSCAGSVKTTHMSSCSLLTRTDENGIVLDPRAGSRRGLRRTDPGTARGPAGEPRATKPAARTAGSRAAGSCGPCRPCPDVPTAHRGPSRSRRS